MMCVCACVYAGGGRGGEGRFMQAVADSMIAAGVERESERTILVNHLLGVLRLLHGRLHVRVQPGYESTEQRRQQVVEEGKKLLWVSACQH